MSCLNNLFKGQSIILSESLVEQIHEKKPNLVVENQDEVPLPQVNFSPRVSQLGSSGHSY